MSSSRTLNAYLPIAVDPACLCTPLVKHQYTSTNVCKCKKQIPMSLYSTASSLLHSYIKITYLTHTYNLLLHLPHTCMNAVTGTINSCGAVRPVKLHNCQNSGEIKKECNVLPPAWVERVWCEGAGSPNKRHVTCWWWGRFKEPHRGGQNGGKYGSCNLIMQP